MSMSMDVVKYRCANGKCGAVDTLRHEHVEPTRPVLDCYKCHAGQGKSLADQIEKHIGMFPVGRWPDAEYAQMERTARVVTMPVVGDMTPAEA